MLANIIKKYLDDNGIKYSFIASEVGMSIKVFSAMLSGNRKMVAEEFIDICRALKTDPNYFAEKVKQIKQAI